MRSTKLLVPSGVPDHDSCGDTFSPTQFGLVPAVLALAAFFGSMLPSLKVEEVNENTSAAKAGCAAYHDASAIPLAHTKLRFNMRSVPLACCIEVGVSGQRRV